MGSLATEVAEITERDHENTTPETVRTLKLAYLTTQYPTVSQTFIRRELCEIERRGHSVLRIAVRPYAGTLVDPQDKQEAARTIQCLAQPWYRFAWAVSATFFTRPVRWFGALAKAVRLGLRSERGVIKHVIYWVEACWLLGVLRRHAIEHVHVHFGRNATIVARLARRMGGPSYSFTVHGPDEFDSVRSFDLGGMSVEAAFVVAISDYCGAQLRRWIPLDHWPRIHVVHCTVGDDFFADTEPISAESRSLVCVGRLCPQKGQLLLVEALRRLIDDGVEGKLVLAGDGEMRSIIEQHIERLGLADHVEITGWIDGDEVRRRIHEARALVLPSFAEGLPMVIMEAFALGRPVISTYIAAIPELVRSGETGWLVMPARVDELANAMRDALICPVDHLAELAAAGRQLVEQRHRTCVETERLERLLARYVDGPA